MEPAQVMDKLQGIFDKVFMEKVTVTPELCAQDVGEWDSLTHINLVVAVEKAFGIRFRTGEVANAQNVGDFVKTIIERLKVKQ
jgi:acyl carrier protein